MILSVIMQTAQKLNFIAAAKTGFGLPEILLIAACACIVTGVITASVIRIKKGKPSIGCDGCCKNCGGCCHSVKEDDK